MSSIRLLFYIAYYVLYTISRHNSLNLKAGFMTCSGKNCDKITFTSKSSSRTDMGIGGAQFSSYLQSPYWLV